MKTTWCRTDGSERWVSAGLGLHQASWRDRPLALRVAGQTSPFLRWAVNWPRGQSVGLEECVSSVCVCVSVCVFGPRQPVIWFTLTRQQDRTIKMSIFSLSLSLSLSLVCSLSPCVLQAEWGRWLNRTNLLEEWHPQRAISGSLIPFFVCHTHEYYVRSGVMPFGSGCCSEATPQDSRAEWM